MPIGRPLDLTANVATKRISVVATANQTDFTVTGGYRINQLGVYRNGIRLVDGRDFIATDGSTVVLLSGATVDDVVEFQVFDSFNNSDAIPTTWLCPASNNVLPEITGSNKKVGVRITKHEVSRMLCKFLEFPIVSTSANISGQEPITNFSDCVSVFGEKVDYIIEGNIGENKKPSRIVDLLSKEILREGG